MPAVEIEGGVALVVEFDPVGRIVVAIPQRVFVAGHELRDDHSLGGPELRGQTRQ
jgi:hypothetical protein